MCFGKEGIFLLGVSRNIQPTASLFTADAELPSKAAEGGTALAFQTAVISSGLMSRTGLL